MSKSTDEIAAELVRLALDRNAPAINRAVEAHRADLTRRETDALVRKLAWTAGIFASRLKATGAPVEQLLDDLERRR